MNTVSTYLAIVAIVSLYFGVRVACRVLDTKQQAWLMAGLCVVAFVIGWIGYFLMRGHPYT